MKIRKPRKTKKNSEYISFLEQVLTNLELEKPVSVSKVKKTLHAASKEVVFYYCRELYLYKKMRKLIEIDTKIVVTMLEFKYGVKL